MLSMETADVLQGPMDTLHDLAHDRGEDDCTLRIHGSIFHSGPFDHSIHLGEVVFETIDVRI